MKLVMALLGLLISEGVSAEKIPERVAPNYTADQDVFVPKSYKEINIPIATWKVRNQEIVQESICVDASTNWNECTSIALKKFAETCTEEKALYYCLAYVRLTEQLKKEKAL